MFLKHAKRQNSFLYKLSLRKRAPRPLMIHSH